MMYKDKDKQKEYQRYWVRQKRAKGSTGLTGRPDIVDVLHARVLANPKVKFKPQSHNPTMIGYVPPEAEI